MSIKSLNPTLNKTLKAVPANTKQDALFAEVVGWRIQSRIISLIWNLIMTHVVSSQKVSANHHLPKRTSVSVCDIREIHVHNEAQDIIEKIRTWGRNINFLPLWYNKGSLHQRSDSCEWCHHAVQVLTCTLKRTSTETGGHCDIFSCGCPTTATAIFY